MKKKVKIGIVGAAGFTGMELLKILDKHKGAEISFITSRTLKDKNVAEVFPSFYSGSGKNYAYIEDADESLVTETELVFLCLPPLKSMEYVKKIEKTVKKGSIKIIDIGSDFRMDDPSGFNEWYGYGHIIPELLPEFTYGLPEINSDIIKKSRFVANPGCYPTSVLLGLLPVIRSGHTLSFINVDSKSGVTGAGKKLSEPYMFTSLSNNFYAYNPQKHRHIGEIEQEIEKIYKKKINVCFTPHLLPVERGIFSTIYCIFEDSFNLKNNEEKIIKIFEDAYGKNYFVKFIGEKVPQLKDVTGTNYCQIGISFDSRTNTLKIFSIIDNLLKGAAGQAVQNMNLMEGFDEREGL